MSECGNPATFVHQIQGSGTAFDPAFGGTRSIEGIVTDVVTNADVNGMHVQEEPSDADADDATSEGIFVPVSAASAPVVGQTARVTGTVAESFGMTILANPTRIEDCGTATETIQARMFSGVE